MYVGLSENLRLMLFAQTIGKYKMVDGRAEVTNWFQAITALTHSKHSSWQFPTEVKLQLNFERTIHLSKINKSKKTSDFKMNSISLNNCEANAPSDATLIIKSLLLAIAQKVSTSLADIADSVRSKEVSLDSNEFKKLFLQSTTKQWVFS